MVLQVADRAPAIEGPVRFRVGAHEVVAERADFPLTLGVSGRGGDVVELTVVEPVSAHATLPLVAGRRQLLYLELDGRCADCSTSEACFRGECRPASREPTCPFVAAVADGERLGTEAEACFADAARDGGAPDASDEEDGGPPPLDGWRGVAMGESHVCALHFGLVRCAGGNTRGQLGNGTRTPSARFEIVAGLPNPELDPAVEVGVGELHSCSRHLSGRIFCWGDNTRGQLGPLAEDVDFRTEAEALAVGGEPATALGLAVGGQFGCFVGIDGAPWCWGAGESGQLGETRPVGAEPTRVSGPWEAVVQVEAGSAHVCARTDEAEVYCWGNAADGRLGASGARGVTQVPIPPASRLAVGAEHACATVDDGAPSVVCWGANDLGQASGASTPLGGPARIVDVAVTASAVPSAGATSSCLLDNGALTCWGDNRYGEIAAAGASPQSAHTRDSDPAWLEVAAGPHALCAVDANQQLSCWGYDSAGQLGRAERLVLAEFTRAPPQTPALELSFGSRHACGRFTSGSGHSCWGESSHHQRGDDSGLAANIAPLLAGEVSGLTQGFAWLRSGERHTCGITTLDPGPLYCWGDNRASQSNAGGGPNTAHYRVPTTTLPAPLDGLAGIAAGARHTCAAVRDSGGMLHTQCWGDDSSGQLGDGAGGEEPPGLWAIAAGRDHTCLISFVGREVYCWGDNRRGQSDPTSDELSLVSATRVLPTLSGFVFVAAGDDFSCAATHAAVHCWGDASVGQLGGGVGSPTEVDVSALGRPIEGLVAAGGHACVWAGGAPARALCWGRNHEGQLGVPPGVSDGPRSVTDVIADLEAVEAVALSPRSTCVTTTEGGGHGLYCAGSDEYWTLGDGKRPIAYDAPALVQTR